MNPANAPPPIPHASASSRSIGYDVVVSRTASVHPTIGSSSSVAEPPTRVFVPTTGGRNMKISRMMPPASPGRATSQYSCAVVRSKPTAVSRGAIALTRYQTANASVRL